MFIDSEKFTFTWSEELPFITTREESKKDTAREKWGRLIAQGWRRTELIGQKKRARAANLLIGGQIILNY